jgi:polyphenol oxidase
MAKARKPIRRVIVESFDSSVEIAVSERSNGSMSKAVSMTERDANRERFLKSHGIEPARTALVHLVYEGKDYCRFTQIDDEWAGDGIIRPASHVNDGLFTIAPNLALLLPVADCVATVLYDPVHRALGLLHLGRHNLEQKAAVEAIRFMHDSFATNPADVKVFLGPAASKESYPLYAFGDRGLQEVAHEQFTFAGVKAVHISADTRDTTTDLTFYSHSEFLKGNRDLDGRQAVVVMLRP